VLANIMKLVGVPRSPQQIVKGAIIVGEVLYEMQQRKRRPKPEHALVARRRRPPS